MEQARCCGETKARSRDIDVGFVSVMVMDDRQLPDPDL